MIDNRPGIFRQCVRLHTTPYQIDSLCCTPQCLICWTVKESVLNVTQRGVGMGRFFNGGPKMTIKLICMFGVTLESFVDRLIPGLKQAQDEVVYQ